MKDVIKYIKENGIVETAFEVGLALFIIVAFVRCSFE
jgi:hypothetical protein